MEQGAARHVAASIGGLPSTGLTDAARRRAQALEAAHMGVFEWHLATDIVECDDRILDLFGLRHPVSASQMFDIIHPDDLERVRAAVSRTVDLDKDYDAAFRVRRKDGTVVWVGGRGRVVERTPEGAPLRMLGVNWDLSDAKDREDRLTHLVMEMNHRVANAFALVELLLFLGREVAHDVPTLADTMTAQIHALADAHQLSEDYFLHKQDSGDRISIDSIVAKTMRVWTIGPAAARILVDVDPTLALHPRDITPLSMILYELATNAAKYSVLGVSQGVLRISVAATPQGRARLIWTETLDRPDLDRATGGGTAGGGIGEVIVAHCLSKIGADSHLRAITAEGFNFTADFDAVTIAPATAGTASPAAITA